MPASNVDAYVLFPGTNKIRVFKINWLIVGWIVYINLKFKAWRQTYTILKDFLKHQN